ncbi:hypothetical protein GCM10007973_27750 [Polymorphobacter multimanifer]|uniref:DUF4331 domain-containing protein n=1 Tax=Polymorphobacter multimanifer TaxID=1070431 RepID=A0A841L513_9SPHN|nr:hypothetical protein [Polymorphobacter multimanifer]MBB6227969.1 hypothetical protein [Polymorphobacter multimanifer]GGI89816.1 hypothetical protein GCM10007973_27750 [Polymorphobacter multimanifer]
MALARWLRTAVPFALAIAGVALVGHRALVAADHFDPPARTGSDTNTVGFDVAADIADLYAFHDDANVYVAIGFGGPSATSLPGFYDPDVLYTINISNTGSRADTEIPIEIRFGRDGVNPGIEVRGLPGVGTLQGPVESNLVTSNGITVRAGVFDDPFFFDPQGLRNSRATGTLSFNNQRNRFARLNSTFVVLSIPRPLLDRGQPLDFWTSSARIRG